MPDLNTCIACIGSTRCSPPSAAVTVQAMAADHHHALRDIKRSAEERASEIKSHAKREVDAIKAELAATQTRNDAALKVRSLQSVCGSMQSAGNLEPLDYLTRAAHLCLGLGRCRAQHGTYYTTCPSPSGWSCAYQMLIALGGNSLLLHPAFDLCMQHHHHAIGGVGICSAKWQLLCPHIS